MSSSLYPTQPYRDTDSRQSSSGMSTVELSSSSSSLYLDYPSQEQGARDDQQKNIRHHHKLRSSPKCSPLIPSSSSDEEYKRAGSHGSQSSAHQRKHTFASVDSLPMHQTTAQVIASEQLSFITINPRSRIYTYVVLIFVVFAIVNAVFQGFESRHDSKFNYQPDLSHIAVSSKLSDKHEAPSKYDNRSTNENREGGAAAAAASISSTSAEPSATVLTRTSQLSYLISNLGAGDVVECYVVTRMAQLTNVVSTVPLGNANSGNRNLDADDSDSPTQSQDTTSASASTASSNQPSGPILIRKSGLAFRYRPRVASVTPNSPDTPNAPKYFEITLEYGPQRTGSTKSYESLPILHVDTETDSVSNKYVSWENEGRVYHSTHISNDWTEAYYMAPITGVVLEKILQRAVDYPRKRPRYQPFEVVSVPSGELIVRSSGSDDFVWDMFRDLAGLYVEIDPILVPPRGKVQFYVADAVPSQKEDADKESHSTVKQREPNPNVQRVKGGLEVGRAAAFYERFYNCANAIKTGDYSMYLPPATPEPTSAPSEETLSSPSMAPSDETTAVPTYSPSVSTKDAAAESSNATHAPIADQNHKNTTSVSDANKTIGVENVISTAENINNTDVHSRFLRSTKDEITSPNNDDEKFRESVTANSTIDYLPANDSNSTLFADEDDVADAAEKLQQAAVEAAENAANVASKNSSAAESATAASQAAEAAKKAADATIAARNKVAAEGIISGDGALATSILSVCFSDPKYGIRQSKYPKKDSYDESAGNDERDTGETIETKESVHAYIYLDGDTFFRLNLTAPYWGTTSMLQIVPQPSLKPEGWGDSVDWAIFTLIFVAAMFGFLVMFHQGRCVTIDKRLRFSWFFKPTEHDKVLWADEVEKDALRRGEGFAHRIGIDAIPTSMGGKLSHYSDNIETIADAADEGSATMLLEMTHRCSEINGMSPSLRIRRDAPDQVQRPTLATTSKPAMPQQSPRNDNESKNSGDFVQNLTVAADGNAESNLSPPFL